MVTILLRQLHNLKSTVKHLSPLDSRSPENTKINIVVL